jgi:hypothetical protein
VKGELREKSKTLGAIFSRAVHNRIYNIEAVNEILHPAYPWTTTVTTNELKAAFDAGKSSDFPRGAKKGD